MATIRQCLQQRRPRMRQKWFHISVKMNFVITASSCVELNVKDNSVPLIKTAPDTRQHGFVRFLW